MDPRVNNAIVLFLKDQGYEKAARKLLEESTSDNKAETLNNPPWKKHKPDGQGSEGENISESLNIYSESYRRLQEWLFLTLDQFRDELWPVSWVVYVHMYLKLVEQGRNQLAVSFREEHKSLHKHAHEEEIRALSLVNTKEQMDKSNYVQRVKNNRFEITLCNYSVEMLVSFLLKNKMLFVLSIVNDHIHIKDRPNKARVPPPQISSLVASGDTDTSSNIVTGVSSEKTTELNSTKVQWGVPFQLQSLYDQTTINGELQRIATDLKLDLNALKHKEKNTSQNNAKPGVVEEEANSKHCPPIQPKSVFGELLKYIVDPQRVPYSRVGDLLKTKESSEGKANSSIQNESDKSKNGSKASSPAKSGSKVDKDAIKEAQAQKQAQLRLQEENLKKFTKIKKKYRLGEWPSIAFHTFFNCHDELVSVDHSKDATITVAGFDDSKVRIWQRLVDESTQDQFRSSSDESEPETHTETLIGHGGPVYAVSLHRECRSLLSASADGYIKLWGKDRGKKGAKLWHNIYNFRLQKFSTPCPIWDVQFSPVGHYFASGSHDNSCRLWDVEHERPLRLFNRHLSDVDCVKWHPNCHYIASGSTDKTARLWDIRDGSSQSCRLFCGHTDTVHSLVIDPSGKYLLSGGQDQKIIAWDIAAGKKINTLEGHTGPIWSLDISPDGKFLCSGSADGTVRVWNTSYIWGKNSASYANKHHKSQQKMGEVNTLQAAKDSTISAPDVAATRAVNAQVQLRTKAQTVGGDAGGVGLSKSALLSYEVDGGSKNSSYLNMYQIVRTYRTKYTPVNLVRFHNERLIFAAGNFALPLMT